MHYGSGSFLKLYYSNYPENRKKCSKVIPYTYTYSGLMKDFRKIKNKNSINYLLEKKWLLKAAVIVLVSLIFLIY